MMAIFKSIVHLKILERYNALFSVERYVTTITMDAKEKIR
jgi:hypothetical protein